MRESFSGGEAISGQNGARTPGIFLEGRRRSPASIRNGRGEDSGSETGDRRQTGMGNSTRLGLLG